VIELLAAISFIAITGYCIAASWPRLQWAFLTLRQPGGLRRQYAAPAASTASLRRTPAPIASTYGRHPDELVRRSALSRDALARDLTDADRTRKSAD